MRKNILLLIFTLCCVNASALHAAVAYAIVSPLGLELDPILKAIKNKTVVTINKMNYTVGYLGGKPVVALIIGVGKANTGASVARVMCDFHPKAIILSGIAGGLQPHLAVGDVVIAKNTFQYEFVEFTDKGIKKNEFLADPAFHPDDPVIYRADKELMNAAVNASKGLSLKALDEHKQPIEAKIVTGLVATNSFPNEANQVRNLKKAGADAIEMEGGAISHVCWRFNVPCLVVRSISDVVVEGEQPTEINLAHMTLASHNAAAVVIALMSVIE